MHAPLTRRLAAFAVLCLAGAALAAPAGAHDGRGGNHGKGDAQRSAHGSRGGGHGCGGGARGCSAVVSVDVLSSFLGVTTAQLRLDVRSGKTLAQETAAAGKQVDALAAAITSAAKTGLDSAVAAGTLTPGQAQAVLLGVPQQAAAIVGGTSKAAAKALLGRCGLVQLDLGTAASVLGLTVAQLRVELAAGKTVAQIAAAAGKTVAGVTSAAASAATTSVDAGVAAGSLTQSQGQSLAASVTQQITTVVTGALGG
jgi:hypothetical protein